MSAERRLSVTIEDASHQVFREDLAENYSFLRLGVTDTQPISLEHEFAGNRVAASIGDFAVGSCTGIHKLSINDKLVNDDYSLSLAQRTLDDGLDSLHCFESILPFIPEESVSRVREDSTMYLSDPNSTRLVVGMYAITHDNGRSHEPWLVFNNELENITFSLREVALQRAGNRGADKLTPIAKKIINPSVETRTNIALSYARELLPEETNTHFASI